MIQGLSRRYRESGSPFGNPVCFIGGGLLARRDSGAVGRGGGGGILQQLRRGPQGSRIGARGLQQLCRGPQDGRIDGGGVLLGPRASNNGGGGGQQGTLLGRHGRPLLEQQGVGGGVCSASGARGGGSRGPRGPCIRRRP